MSEKIKNELTKVKFISSEVNKDSILKLMPASEDLSQLGSKTINLYFKEFEDNGGTEKDEVPNEENFERSIETLRQLKVKEELIEKIEAVGFDGTLEPVLKEVGDEIVMGALTGELSEDDLPELYLSVTEQDELLFTLRPLAIRPDKLGDKLSKELSDVLLDEPEKRQVEIVAIEDNNMFGQLEFVFEFDFGDNVGKKLLRASQIEEKVDGEDETFKTRYSTNLTFNLGKKLRNSKDLSPELEEQYNTIVEADKTKGFAQAEKKFEKMYGRSLKDVIENDDVKAKAQIKQVENSGRDTAYIVLRNLEFLD